MKKEELKKIASVSGGIKEIVNNIAGKVDFTIEGKRFFIPYTNSSCFSDWAVLIEVKYRTTTYSAWFRKLGDSWYLDYIWNGGSGKKLRRDAKYNILLNLKKKAGLLSESVEEIKELVSNNLSIINNQ